MVSRKLIEWDEEVCVNLMFGWYELRYVINVFREGEPCVQIIKMSSMYRFHMRGCKLLGVEKRIEFSRSDRKILA